jgi:hypothetical protein
MSLKAPVPGSPFKTQGLQTLQQVRTVLKAQPLSFAAPQRR